ncbi:chemotaxis protein CheD [Aquamicrobium sp. LC103]|uniref:chemotaxis protein CheD n=1 Tax=Aquamicrobium sp. LC103 TaxID=1120658 RepID=UPI00063E8A8A|nr:chemotaxis protein CheD [Aquamicrobium sp. LC103]TKT75513.1 chemotaxis protein CheD [Aquamicrobium sp. LC103]
MRGEAAAAKIHVVQGEQFVTDDPGIVLSTLLGSCVSACMRDPVAAVGGMNHFLLPGGVASAADGVAQRHAVHAMELLVNELLKRGARRERLEAKLFGGARLIDGLTDIGSKNADFAERFLAAEGIRLVGGSLRGEQGRKLQYWPVSGRARQSLMERENRQVFDAERRSRPVAVPAGEGAVELF